MNLYFWNQTVRFAENIKDNLADCYCPTLFLVTGIVVVVTNGQRFRVFIQIPIAARTDGASCAGIPHDLHWWFLCNVERKNENVNLLAVHELIRGILSVTLVLCLNHDLVTPSWECVDMWHKTVKCKEVSKKSVWQMKIKFSTHLSLKY